MNKIESYVDSVIPKNIPKSKQKILRAEIEAHIFDRIDFYTEIGYDTDASIDKAIADMGEDEEVKTSIRNDFEELHYESKWWAVIVGLGMLFLHFITFFITWIDYEGFDDYRPAVYGENDATAAIWGLVSTFIVIMLINIFYKKGYRKSLISLGITNLITFHFSTYIFCAVFSIYEVIAFLVVKATSLQYIIDIDFQQNFYIFAYCLMIILSLTCFYLSNRLSKNGEPKKSYKGTAIFCIVYLVVSVFTVSLIVPAEKYFFFYPDWFDAETDMPNPTAENVYKRLNEKSTEQQLKNEMGFITVDDYIKSFDADTGKKIMNDFNELSFFFGDDYKVWFDPEFIEQYEKFDGNGFVYTKTDENGYILSKGVGNAFSDLRTINGAYVFFSIPDCVDTFLSYKGGESKEDVFDFYSKEQGWICCEFTTYTESGENNYYRIACKGEPNAGMWNSKGDESCDIYIELWFENGALTDGKLHYPEFHYQEGEEGYSYSYDNYYTLAD